MSTVFVAFYYLLPWIIPMVLPALIGAWLLEQITEYNTRKSRKH